MQQIGCRWAAIDAQQQGRRDMLLADPKTEDNIMSNVTNLAVKRASRLAKHEIRIQELGMRRSQDRTAIGIELVRIAQEGEFASVHGFLSFDKYLFDLADRLLGTGAQMSRTQLQTYYEASKLGLEIKAGKMPKAYKEYFESAGTGAQSRMSHIVKREIRNSAEPINEAVAFKMLIDDGYFDLDEHPSSDYVTTVKETLKRSYDPDRLAHSLEQRMYQVIELVDMHTAKELREAYEYANVRRAAKRLRKLTNSILDWGKHEIR